LFKNEKKYLSQRYMALSKRITRFRNEPYFAGHVLQTERQLFGNETMDRFGRTEFLFISVEFKVNIHQTSTFF